MNKKLLISGLNRLYSDRVNYVDRHTILVYSKGDDIDVGLFLQECVGLGLLEIVKPIMEAADQDNCIRLISQIPSDLCSNNK